MESEKDLNTKQTKENVQVVEGEENNLVCVFIKDLSDAYIRYDVKLV